MIQVLKVGVRCVAAKFSITAEAPIASISGKPGRSLVALADGELQAHLFKLPPPKGGGNLNRRRYTLQLRFRHAHAGGFMLSLASTRMIVCRATSNSMQ